MTTGSERLLRGQRRRPRASGGAAALTALALTAVVSAACYDPVGFQDADDTRDTGDSSIGPFPDLADDVADIGDSADTSDAPDTPDTPDTRQEEPDMRDDGQPARYCWEHGGTSEEQQITIALDEDLLVVGLADDGLVSVWDLTLGGQVKVADLLPDATIPEGVDFGMAVAIGGSAVLTGAPSWSRGTDVGHVFHFERDGTDWSAGAPLVPDESTTGAQGFGSAVGIGEDYFAAASVTDHALRIYPLGGAPFVPEDELTWPSAGEGFGGSVALEEDRVVVGVPLATDEAVVEAGHAVVYERLSADDWQIETALVSPNPTEGAHFGQGVAMTSITNDLLVAVSEPETKMVHVYQEGSSGWQLYDSVSETADLYAQSIAFFEGFLAVGAEDAAYLYRAEVTGYDPVPGSPFISPDLEFLGIDFGAAVALSDTWLVATAPAIDSVCAFELRRRGP